MDSLRGQWPDDDRRDGALARLHQRVTGGMVIRNGNHAVHKPSPERRRLSTGEWYALVCASHGMSRAESAEILGVCAETIANRRERARHILRAKNTTHAVAIAIRLGLIP